jgi:hypothetical protein
MERLIAPTTFCKVCACRRKQSLISRPSARAADGRKRGAERRMDRPAALNSPAALAARLALLAGTRGASVPPAVAAAPLAASARGFTILCTSVIEMGVSNSVAVCATIYANRFPLCTSLTPPVARSPSLSPFLFRARLCLASCLTRQRAQRKERKRKIEERRKKWRFRRTPA